MTNTDVTMWGIHAGATGDADTLFLQNNCIAIGWPLMGDLSQLPDDITVYRQNLIQEYSAYKPRAIPVNAGQLHRFARIMQIGDLVVYPSKQDRKIHIGKVTGDYCYNSSDLNYPNQRSVTWLKQFPRSDFPQAALFEVGAAMSLFRIKNYTSNFMAVLQGQTGPAAAPPSNTTVPGAITDTDIAPLIADNIEDITKDFILQQLAMHLKGHPFATLIAHLFEVMGYRTKVSPPGPDGGVDIVAHKDEFALLPPIIKIQVKSANGNISSSDVASLNGVLGQAEYGIFVTIGAFTSPAKTSAGTMSKMRLLDGEAVAALFLQHYEALDPKYKNIVPLRRVYAPDETDYQSS